MKNFQDEIQARSFLEEKGFTFTKNYEILPPQDVSDENFTDLETEALKCLLSDFGYEMYADQFFD